MKKLRTHLKLRIRMKLSRRVRTWKSNLSRRRKSRFRKNPNKKKRRRIYTSPKLSTQPFAMQISPH
jgi:hypothetical protein